jgi:hydroxymethylpyrimidine/phosphomethylpyrimidine kinase
VVPIALTIAGSDSSGGAGIQADLKTFSAFGVYGTTVLTALTAQNTRGVRAVTHVAPGFVAQQIDAVMDDLDIGAAKTGMLAQRVVIEVVVDRLRARSVRHLVVDPVMVSTAGDRLLDEDAVDCLRAKLLPLATLLTPNLHEAEILTGRPVTTAAEMHDAARALVDLGARAVLVKGGHLGACGGERAAPESLDVLHDGRSATEFSGPRIATRNTHGTGCTLSAAITAGLACGQELDAAVAAAKRYVIRAIETAWPIGHGPGPLNHFVSTDTVTTGRR